MGKLQVRRGLAANRPNPLDIGELGWDTDGKRLWMGTGNANENVFIGGAAATDAYEIYVSTDGDTLANGQTGLLLLQVAADNDPENTTTTTICAGASDPFVEATHDGQVIYNVTRDAWSVATYVAADKITCNPAITDQAAGDVIRIVSALSTLEEAYS